MMDRYKGYWVCGDALPGPPNTVYWEAKGAVLKDGRAGSVVEVGRIQDPGINFDFKELAEWYGFTLSEIVVDLCLPAK